jgi:hypothetical protein
MEHFVRTFSAYSQISHKLPERRILVAQCCGQLAQYIDAPLRSTLILSSLDQLRDDPSPAVRQSVAQNLSLLLPLIPEKDKFSKVQRFGYLIDHG